MKQLNLVIISISVLLVCVPIRIIFNITDYYNPFVLAVLSILITFIIQNIYNRSTVPEFKDILLNLIYRSSIYLLFYILTIIFFSLLSHLYYYVDFLIIVDLFTSYCTISDNGALLNNDMNQLSELNRKSGVRSNDLVRKIRQAKTFTEKRSLIMVLVEEQKRKRSYAKLICLQRGSTRVRSDHLKTRGDKYLRHIKDVFEKKKIKVFFSFFHSCIWFYLIVFI